MDILTPILTALLTAIFAFIAFHYQQQNNKKTYYYEMILKEIATIEAYIKRIEVRRSFVSNTSKSVEDVEKIIEHILTIKSLTPPAGAYIKRSKLNKIEEYSDSSLEYFIQAKDNAFNYNSNENVSAFISLVFNKENGENIERVREDFQEKMEDDVSLVYQIIFSKSLLVHLLLFSFAIYMGYILSILY